MTVYTQTVDSSIALNNWRFSLARFKVAKGTQIYEALVLLSFECDFKADET